MLAVFISCGNSNFFPSSTAIVAITISPTDAGVQLSAATEQFSAQGTFGNGNTGDVTGDVNWSSSSPAVATISQAGLATAVASGTTTITAKSSSTSATTSLTVLNVTSITITGGTSLAASGSEQLTAVDQDSNNITNFVTWNSDNTDLVTVSSTGVASAQSLSVGGTANITATLPGASGNTITSNTLSISVSAT
jgi:Big-like domain-containing protein